MFDHVGFKEAFVFVCMHLKQVGRESLEQYKALKKDTQKLNKVLDELVDIVRMKRQSVDQSTKLLQHGQNVKDLLVDLEQKLRNYECLTIKSRVTFDRLKWSHPETKSLRSQINSKVVMLNNFLLTVVASGRSVLVQGLNEILQEVRAGTARRRLCATPSRARKWLSYHGLGPFWRLHLGRNHFYASPMYLVEPWSPNAKYGRGSLGRFLFRRTKFTSGR